MSEQRRALLLPQEVKELPPDEAIVFYEGLRPIRCKKLRYFEERIFRARLLPPPALPAPQADAPGVRSDSGAVMQTARPGTDDAALAAVTREATMQDIDRIESIGLEELGIDAGKVRLPEKAEGERLTDEELRTAAESFLASLRSQ